MSRVSLGQDTEAKLYDVWKGRKEHTLTAASAIEIDVAPDGVLMIDDNWQEDYGK